MVAVTEKPSIMVSIDYFSNYISSVTTDKKDVNIIIFSLLYSVYRLHKLRNQMVVLYVNDIAAGDFELKYSVQTATVPAKQQ